ncbi:hypothetical protein BGZ61DRAFT_453074 [Ilyonectria robusta]|uniref:uncharacterized protein n=1 Tax=Ilyonectria robusta TaxID=1079257 RepID=UPI001E8D03A1|nr:uncharacterized protein BGZ61DRAFT_453074 [Ilyonectria robusta]KAH8688321.1 hypothetical protein BGZ61DRAFT_453074 [Ilyonectria robusta]
MSSIVLAIFRAAASRASPPSISTADVAIRSVIGFPTAWHRTWMALSPSPTLMWKDSTIVVVWVAIDAYYSLTLTV